MPSPFSQSSQNTLAQYQPDGVSPFHAVIPAVYGLYWDKQQAVDEQDAGPGSVVLLLSLQSAWDLEDISLMLHDRGMIQPKPSCSYILACLSTDALIPPHAPELLQPCTHCFWQPHCTFALLPQIPSHSSSLLKAFKHQALQVGLAEDSLYISASTASLSSLL